ncbi:MAG: PQQ-dependent sugar dehydrogenase [Pirellulales bacterium]
MHIRHRYWAFGLATLVGCALLYSGTSSTPPELVTVAAPVKAAVAVSPTPLAGRTKMPLRGGHWVPYVCEPAFSGHTFFDPLYVVPLPDGSGRMMVVERRGTIQMLYQHTEGCTKDVFLDITSQIEQMLNEAEQGLLGLAFHPQYTDEMSPHRGEFFVYYTARTPNGSTNRLSRFFALDERIDGVKDGSEVVLIDQPDGHQAHNAGSLLFGADGFLYLALGDDAKTDPNPHAQSITNDLFSGVLRIDVDCQGGAVSHPPKRQPTTGKTGGYFIPSDNPFVGHPNALEEFFVIGLRNPWRMSFDRETQLLYVTDPGEQRREEINVVQAGSNCQWTYAEGTIDRREFEPAAPLRPVPYLGVETPPLFEYSRDAAHRCVIGGHVYRGKQFPELIGKYVYADQSGRIYALELTDGGRRATAQKLIAVLPHPGIGISSLGEDATGELYFCTIGDLATETGQVYQLRRTETEEWTQVPATLAATGVFDDWQTLEPADGLIPYDVTLAFWSDGADKQRWISAPHLKQVRLAQQSSFQFAPGTVFVKHFDLATNRQRPEDRRRIETRVLVCDDQGGTYGATYRWSADGQKTQIVELSETEEIEITQADGTHHKQTWYYPGRFACVLCHNEASGHVLGFNLKQLRRGVKCPDGTTEPQLARLVRESVVASEVLAVSESSMPRLTPLDDQSASLDVRARSYLDVNCSVCHNPNTRFAGFDARLERDPNEQGLINGAAYHHGSLGPHQRIVKPGDVPLSVLHLRMSSADPVLRMPPVGSTVVDRQAEQLIRQWIESLPQPVPEVAEVSNENNTKL